MTTYPRPYLVISYDTAYDTASEEIARIEAQLRDRATGEPARQRASVKTESRESLAARAAELRAATEATRVHVTLMALPRREYRALVTAHAPRPGDDLDKRLGYNADTFGDALIAACIAATTRPDGTPVDPEWDVWADAMGNREWQQFFTAAMSLNNAESGARPQ